MARTERERPEDPEHAAVLGLLRGHRQRAVRVHERRASMTTAPPAITATTARQATTIRLMMWSFSRMRLVGERERQRRAAFTFGERADECRPCIVQSSRVRRVNRLEIERYGGSGLRNRVDRNFQIPLIEIHDAA